MPFLNTIIKPCFIVILLSSGAILNAQNQSVNFERITINDGLSLSSVYCIFQDSKGFMWFGTEDGLNKYNGSSFVIYNNRPGDLNSLSHKWTEQIVEDMEGMIWVGSRNGLTRLDPKTDEMVQCTAESQGDGKISNDTIITLVQSGKYIWAGTQNGLNRIHIQSLETKQFYPGRGTKNCRIHALHIDEKGRLWVGSSCGLYVNLPGFDNLIPVSSGEKQLDVHAIETKADTLWVGTDQALIKYILKNELEVSFRYPGIQTDTRQTITNLHKDKKNRLWVQTEEGLFLFLSNEKLVRIIHAPEPTPSLSVKPVKPLLEDQDGNIWYGTFNTGMYEFTNEGNIRRFVHADANPSSLSDNTVNCIYQDRSGSIWIGTFGAGINILKTQANLIEVLRHNAFDQQSMSSSFVWSIMEDRKGKVWIGTNQTGINVFDPVDRTFRYYDHDPNDPNSLSSSSIRDIFQSSRGTIWVGTDGGGLCRFNPQDGSFVHYIHDPNDPTSISNSSVRTIYEDSTGILWIGTRNGLNKFDPRKGIFKHYFHDPDDPNSLAHNFVYSSIYMDQEGLLWIGTYGGGLSRLDTKTGTFRNYQFDPADPSSISDNIVFSIYEDGKGYLWIGTNSGLNLFNPSTGKFKRYGMEEGLPNDVIYGIMPDYQNRLWMTTNKGISRLDLTEFEFKNFDVRDGLQSNEFNGGAFHAGRSGKIYAGGVYGMNIIDPSKIVPEKNHAEIIISRLEILGKEVAVMPQNVYGEDPGDQPGEEGEQLIEIVDNYFLPVHVTYLDKIKLNYRQRFFSIEFAALNHHMPEKLNYIYRMVNLEDHWNPVGNRNFVTYANMKPGVYTFEVDAKNTDGYLTNKPARLRIVITPPFWRQFWFIIIEALALLGVAIFIYRFLLHQRTNKLLKVQNTEIRKAHDQLQISENNLKELNITKDKFFSIISHDLKNPFASVMSISEVLSDQFDNTEKEDLKYGVKKIHETNQYIYTLLENLLTWSKSQRGKLSIEAGKFNLSKVIETNINIVKLSAEKKNITLVSEIKDDICAHADREMISTVIRNLLTNAIKFTKPGKSVKIAVEIEDAVNRVSIIDEGVGIQATDLDRLFRIEDKIKRDGTAGEKGTGLGLIICKEFVEINGGSIEVRSEPGSGSVFTFTIPRPENSEPSSC